MVKYKHRFKMKTQKDRVIAIDYFRGICILIVLLNHSSLFSTPFNYIAGGGSLWTSAAEMFFLLSGVTLGIVRGPKIKSDFYSVAKKIWQRAGMLYVVNTLVVLFSLCLALLLSNHGLTNDIPGAISSQSSLGLLGRIMSFSYSIGWANFLMYYAVFLLFAPFALYILRGRWWPAVPLSSIVLFALGHGLIPAGSPYFGFSVWQVYFVLGLTLARLRVPLIGRYYSLNDSLRKKSSAAILGLAAACLAISQLLSGSGQHLVKIISAHGWLPRQLQTAYSVLINHKSAIDYWLLNNRSGLLRPAATLLIFGAFYLVYQKYKITILYRTGWFVNAMGKDTLWIFVAQAVAIPLLSAIPLRHNNLFNNFLLTSTLLIMMWAITKRRALKPALAAYMLELKTSYNNAKYGYIYRSENDA
jgi:hypothetical protein